MGKTIDIQTHEDLVVLIESEMRSVCRARGYTGAPERLASLIEGRLGYETPKRSCLPDITQGERSIGVRTDNRNDLYYVFMKDNSGRLLANNIPTKADAVLIAAAPKLAEALFEIRKHNILSDKWKTKKQWLNMVDGILREAGADI